MATYEERTEQDVLTEMNKNFRKSKVMQIIRFLHDQDVLNKRFHEFDLETDHETETSDSECSLTPQKRLQRLRAAKRHDSDRESDSYSAIDHGLEVFEETGGNWEEAVPLLKSSKSSAIIRRRRYKSKTEDSSKKVLKKINIRPASAVGYRKQQGDKQSKDFSLKTLLPQSSPVPDVKCKSHSNWDYHHTNGKLMSPREIMVYGPSSARRRSEQSPITPIIMPRHETFRDRSLRYSTDQFEIHEISTNIRTDSTDLKCVRKTKLLCDLNDIPGAGITMVKLPPLETTKLSGPSLVNTF